MWQRGLPPWLALLLLGAGCQFATGLSDLEAGDLKLGKRCTHGVECRSGRCVDGVCCDSDCDGACLACALTGAAGRCVPHTVGTDPEDDCGEPGYCDGSGACAGGVHQWSWSFGPAGHQCIHDVAVDRRDGSIVLVGQFQGSVSIANRQHTTEANDQELLVVKLASDGGYLWSRAYGDAGEDSATSVAISDSGNIVVAGTFEISLDLSDGQLHVPLPGQTGTFVAQIAPDGSPLRSLSLTGFTPLGAPRIAARANGEFALAGGFSGVVRLAGNEFDGQVGAEHVYLAKFAASGLPLWSRHLVGSGPNSVEGLPVVGGLAVDEEGAVIVGGSFLQTLVIDGHVLDAWSLGAAPSMFLARFAGDGLLDWANRHGSEHAQVLTALTVDGTDIVIAGGSAGPFDLGGVALDTTVPGDFDLFAARVGAGESVPFATLYTGQGHDPNAVTAPSSIAVDDLGNVVLTGLLGTPVDFGGGPLAPATGASNTDAFWVKHNNLGQHVLSKRFGDDQDQWSWAIAVDGAGSMIIAGCFLGDLDFGGGDLPAWPSEGDAFVAKFAP